MKVGSILTYKNIQIKRPMIGLKPEDKFKIIGKKLNQRVVKDQPILLRHFS